MLKLDNPTSTSPLLLPHLPLLPPPRRLLYSLRPLRLPNILMIFLFAFFSLFQILLPPALLHVHAGPPQCTVDTPLFDQCWQTQCPQMISMLDHFCDTGFDHLF
ncbi:unnamed protein product, partial [Amoebophrya sp. A25]|eukprot:GSA25T00005532001.1